VYKVSLGQVFLRVFRFPLPFSIHRMFCTHLSPEAGTIGQLVADVPSGLSITPSHEIKKRNLHRFVTPEGGCTCEENWACSCLSRGSRLQSCNIVQSMPVFPQTLRSLVEIPLVAYMLVIFLSYYRFGASKQKPNSSDYSVTIQVAPHCSTGVYQHPLRCAIALITQHSITSSRS
jgi:hypothetical protein